MAKTRKPKKAGPPPPRAEPTTHQLRQEYYRARAEGKALEELGIRAPDAPPPKGDAIPYSDARDTLDRLELIHAVWRWLGLTGSAPLPEDWDPQDGWPHPDEADALFGSWDKMLDASRIDESIVGELIDKVLAAHETLASREREQEAVARKLEEDAKREPELRRQADAQRARREQAETQRQEAQAARDAIARERDALAARGAELEREVAQLREAVEAAPPELPAESELLEEMEATLAAQARTQAQRDELHEHIERLRVEREGDRRTIEELTRLLASIDVTAGGEAAAAAAVEPETAPATVLEAVERAAAEARHLRFAPRAFETAAESPFRRPGLVLRTLRSLDDLAGRHAAGEMGVSLVQAAAEHGITQYKHDISETTRKRYRDDYTFTLDGRELWVGPHIGLGSGSGAGFVARIYLHVSDGSDGLERGITVAVVGRHLPDSTT